MLSQRPRPAAPSGLTSDAESRSFFRGEAPDSGCAPRGSTGRAGQRPLSVSSPEGGQGLCQLCPTAESSHSSPFTGSRPTHPCFAHLPRPLLLEEPCLQEADPFILPEPWQRSEDAQTHSSGPWVGLKGYSLISSSSKFSSSFKRNISYQVFPELPRQPCSRPAL